jgi:hypothetical protein
MKKDPPPQEKSSARPGSFHKLLSEATRQKLLEAALAMRVPLGSSFDPKEWEKRFQEMIAVLSDQDYRTLAECLIAVTAHARTRQNRH